jgi:glutaredoxin
LNDKEVHIVKKITAFLLTGCPYCRNGLKEYNELCEEHPEYKNIPVDWIYEDKQPEVADQYDYYYVPTLFIGDEKLYECKPGQDINQIRENFERVLQEALP